MTPRTRQALADLAAITLIFLALWVPDAAHLVGSMYVTDGFFHWDHFVMAPALAWRHGMALGVDAYSQYGAGWPLVVNALAGDGPLRHQGVIELGVLYGITIHIGLYVLLVVFSRSAALALAGTAFALFLSVFAPRLSTMDISVLWEWPSMTVLRAPTEVWFFLALLLHARGRRPAACIVAGLFVGLGLLLETDTGIFLAATFAVYGLCLVLADRIAGLDPARESAARTSRTPAVLAATLLALLVPLIAGLAVSSRGALLADPGGYLAGWIGGVTNSSALGVGARLFAWFLASHGEELPQALAVMAPGLLAVGWTQARLLHGRLDATSLFAGCVGLYATARCTLFVWRTVPIRLGLVAVPLAILAVVALAGLRRPVGDALRRLLGSEAPRLDLALPALALLAALGGVVASPTFHAYPNVWRTALRGPPKPGLALIPERGEITGLPVEAHARVRALGEAIAEVRTRAARGERVAILDVEKTLLFVEADVRPFRGSPSWFANTWTWEEAEKLAATLGPGGPDAAIIRTGPTVARVGDVWARFHAVLVRDYRLAKRIGLYEVWERPATP